MTLPANVNDIITGLQTAQSRIQTPDGDVQFIKMNKAGLWIFGSDEIDIEDDSLWAVNPNSFVTGFVAWDDDGGLQGEEMRSVLEDPITAVDLPDVGAPWKQQVGFQMACTNGEDAGVQVLYKTNSVGGTKAVAELLDAILTKVKNAPGDAAIVPLVELGSSSYKHKKYGKIYTPVLAIQSWATMDAEPGALVEPEPESEPEPEPQKPARRRRRAQ
jgi:hypothetical protein